MNRIYNLTDISNIKRISFRQDINGLRALAVLAVVFYHAELELFKGGWLGVDIFFVISGYLISNIIISEHNEGIFSFKNFYLRRVKRILPALFSTLLLTIPFAYFFLTPKAMEEYLDSLIASIFFYANYHFMNLDFYVAESTKLMPLLHTWSLSIEEQYYLLFPLFAFIVYKYFKNYFTFFIGFLTLFSLYLNTLSQSSGKFYKLEFRIWELLLGVLVMILSSNFKIKHLEKIGLPLMLFPIFYFGDTFINDLEPKLVALIGISLIIFSNTESSILTKILSFKLISIIGLSSYSIYLLHQPVFAYYRYLKKNIEIFLIKYFNLNVSSSIDILNSNNLNNVDFIDREHYFISILLIVFTLFIGYLSYRFIEIRFLNYKNFNYFYIIFFIIIILFLILSYLKIEKTNISSRTTNETVFSEYKCWDKIDIFNDNILKLEDCIVNNNSNKKLLIIGDSSSVSISKSIIENNLFNNFNIYFITINHKEFFKNFEGAGNCNNCFFEWIKKNNKETLIVSIELHRYIEKESIYYTKEYSNFDSEIFENNIKFLSKHSYKLLLLEPFPTMLQKNLNPKELIESDKLNQINEIYISYPIWTQNTIFTKKILNNLEKSLLVSLVKIEDLFCNKNTLKCSVYKDSSLLYLDKFHLTKDGGMLIAKKIELYLDN